MQVYLGVDLFRIALLQDGRFNRGEIKRIQTDRQKSQTSIAAILNFEPHRLNTPSMERNAEQLPRLTGAGHSRRDADGTVLLNLLALEKRDVIDRRRIEVTGAARRAQKDQTRDEYSSGSPIAPAPGPLDGGTRAVLGRFALRSHAVTSPSLGPSAGA